jgi:hypothetical protein
VLTLAVCVRAAQLQCSTGGLDRALHFPFIEHVMPAPRAHMQATHHLSLTIGQKERITSTPMIASQIYTSYAAVTQKKEVSKHFTHNIKSTFLAKCIYSIYQILSYSTTYSETSYLGKVGK